MEINFERLIRLQDLDELIQDISQFLDSTPTQIGFIDEQIAESSQIVVDAKNELSANQKKRRTLESDVSEKKSQIDRYKKQLNDVKTNKEYTSLLKEVEDVESEIGELEEEIISEMLAADDLEAAIKTAEKKAETDKDELLKEKAELLTKKADQDAERMKLRHEREMLIPTVPSDQMRLYNNIFRKCTGTALSPVTDDFCSMCQIRIRPQVLNELIARKEIILCENCGRILFWKPQE